MYYIYFYVSDPFYESDDIAIML